MLVWVKPLACIGVLAAVLGFSLAPQDGKQDGTQDGMMGPPKPTAEHEWIAKGAGTWNAKGWFQMGPEKMPIEGVETITMMPGGLWQTFDFKENSGAFHGHGVFGYDTHKKKFVSVWVDNMNTAMSVGEGTLDADMKVLTSTVKTTNPEGKSETNREVVTRRDDGSVLFQMYKEGGKDPVLEIVYTKAM